MAIFTKATATPAKIGSLNCDVILEREATYDSRVTEYPVEDGFPISDHVTRNPLTLTMTVICTPTPLSGAKPSRMNSVANAIKNIYKAGEPITVTVPDAIYENMVMTHAPLPRNVRDGVCYRMQLDFVQVRKAQAKTEEVPEGNTSSEASAMSGETGKDAGQASQVDIGAGVDDTSSINTKPLGNTNGGDFTTGYEQTATAAIEMIQNTMVGTSWRAA